VLTIAGHRHELAADRVVVGRSKDCGIQVADPNVSRRHAEIRRDGDAFVLVDLDSTNGVEVDGKRVKRLELRDGSRFTIGSTEVAFSEELP
jgi:pSer/pThr/pTyr-binding forkhead associated (FHA) protein